MCLCLVESFFSSICEEDGELAGGFGRGSLMGTGVFAFYGGEGVGFWGGVTPVLVVRNGRGGRV